MDEQELKEAFDHFDSDGNGAIDRDEFAQLMKNLDPEMSSEEVAIGFAEIDRDGSGTIELDEFIAWWLDH